VPRARENERVEVAGAVAQQGTATGRAPTHTDGGSAATPARSAHPRERHHDVTRLERALALLLLLVPIVTVAVGFWPGHMSADSLSQIAQVRSGDFTNQHAPLLMTLWRPLYLHLGAGPGWILTAQLVTFVAGCYLVLRAAFRPVGAAGATTLVCFLPPVFGMLGYVGRDTWFAALLVLAFGLTVRATMTRPPARWVWMGAAVIIAWLTLASRQNAAASVVIVCIVLAYLLLAQWRGWERIAPRRLSGRWRLGLTATVAGIALTIVMMSTQLAGNALLGVRDVNPEQYLLIYDLAALSERERENLFPREAMRQRGMEPVDTYWNIDNMNGYVFSNPAPIPAPLSSEGVAALRESWLDAVGNDPLEYLDVRVDLFLRQLTLTRSAIWTYHPVIDPNPFGYVVRFSGPNSAAKDYVEAFATPQLDGGWIYSVWAYLLVAVAATAVLLRSSRGWPLAAVGALSLAALTHQAGLFLGALGTGYRYEFVVVVIGSLGAAVLLRVAWNRFRRARHAA
jgi:hypothetical protein